MPLCAAMPLPACFAALVIAAAADPAPLTARERAGRDIYREGKSAWGNAVNVLVGATSLSAEQVTCAGCHGDDGLGRPEGGVTPTPIAWSELTKPWGRTLTGGRRHPPYDERTLARAVTEGIDAGGNRLDAVMPRYSMSRADMEALVAYVKRLGNEPMPGVGRDEVRVGTVLPSAGPLADVGRAIRGALEEWAAVTNAAGGVYGRRVALHVASYDPAREGGLESARSLMRQRDLLALVSGFAPAAESDLADLADEQGVPLVGPYTPWPAPGATRDRVFYLLGGPREHARLLAAHAIREGGGATSSSLVVHAADARDTDAAHAAVERFRASGWTPEVVAFEHGRLDADAITARHASGTEWLLFLGPDGDLATLLQSASARGWTPRVLASGALTGRAALSAPSVFRDRIVLAMPTAPGDESVAGREALARAAHRAPPGERFHAARASAWGAAQVLAEGLRRAGRGVSRDRLVASLEALNGFETGVLPPLSYGPGRRIGAAGAWLVAADLDAKGFRVIGWSAEDSR